MSLENLYKRFSNDDLSREAFIVKRWLELKTGFIKCNDFNHLPQSVRKAETARCALKELVNKGHVEVHKSIDGRPSSWALAGVEVHKAEVHRMKKPSSKALYSPHTDSSPLRSSANDSVGMKHDTEKPAMELLIQGCPRALEAVGKVLSFGAEKYARHNWLQVNNGENRYWGAKVRHELARAMGEDNDPDSGLPHLAHEATNVLFLLELELRKGGADG